MRIIIKITIWYLCVCMLPSPCLLTSSFSGWFRSRSISYMFVIQVPVRCTPHFEKKNGLKSYSPSSWIKDDYINVCFCHRCLNKWSSLKVGWVSIETFFKLVSMLMGLLIIHVVFQFRTIAHKVCCMLCVRVEWHVLSLFFFFFSKKTLFSFQHRTCFNEKCIIISNHFRINASGYK